MDDTTMRPAVGAPVPTRGPTEKTSRFSGSNGPTSAGTSRQPISAFHPRGPSQTRGSGVSSTLSIPLSRSTRRNWPAYPPLLTCIPWSPCRPSRACARLPLLLTSPASSSGGRKSASRGSPPRHRHRRLVSPPRDDRREPGDCSQDARECAHPRAPSRHGAATRATGAQAR